MTDPQIILASASPRRLELLNQIGIQCKVYPVDINEEAKPNESAVDLVTRLAKEKAQAGWHRTEEKLPALSSDTLGLIDSDLLIKPRDFEHARDMLMHMSGSWHEIYTAVAVCFEDKTDVLLSKNRVRFTKLSEQDIQSYWKTGEPQDKAGAYAIQGIGAVFIEELQGSYSAVMGLPLRETMLLLKDVGVNLLESRINENIKLDHYNRGGVALNCEHR